MEDLNLGDLVGQPYGFHKHYSVSFHVVNAKRVPSSYSFGQIKITAVILCLAWCVLMYQ